MPLENSRGIIIINFVMTLKICHCAKYSISSVYLTYSNTYLVFYYLI